ncbi:MAG TPA: DUF483 domain-containing protein [Candidatus Methanomethylia archaeon]|nr:DUF483 domain-containing protein [Candidatus Methanomethylicia archaeon]
MNSNPAIDGLRRILRIVKDLASLASSSNFREEASTRYPTFPSIAAHIAEQFAEECVLEAIPRIERQLEIVEKYMPPVRPALDPIAGLELGIYSRLFSDREIGFFMGYPGCCVEKFASELQIGFTKQHVEELTEVLSENQVLVITAGFIPCSLKCVKAREKGLLAVVSKEEVSRLVELEKELYHELPHFHYEYMEHYYEYLRKTSPPPTII